MKHPEHSSTEWLNQTKSSQLLWAIAWVLPLEWAGNHSAHYPISNRVASGRPPANLLQCFPDALSHPPAFYDLQITSPRSYTTLPVNAWWVFVASESKKTLDFWFLSPWTHTSSRLRNWSLIWWLDLIHSWLEGQLKRAAPTPSAGYEACKLVQYQGIQFYPIFSGKFPASSNYNVFH